MKPISAMAVIAACTVLAATGALAQQTPPGPPAGAPTPGAPRADGGDQHFQEHKQELLAHIADRIAKMQEYLSCVQASTNRDQIRACRPMHPEHPPGK